MDSLPCHFRASASGRMRPVAADPTQRFQLSIENACAGSSCVIRAALPPYLRAWGDPPLRVRCARPLAGVCASTLQRRWRAAAKAWRRAGGARTSTTRRRLLRRLNHPIGFGIWSGKRDSNPRPQAWEACALPTELFPQRGRTIAPSDALQKTKLDRRALSPIRGGCRRAKNDDAHSGDHSVTMRVPGHVVCIAQPAALRPQRLGYGTPSAPARVLSGAQHRRRFGSL
jgi:hypothetical protein